VGLNFFLPSFARQQPSIVSQLTSAGPAVLVVLVLELDSAPLRARESMASTSPCPLKHGMYATHFEQVSAQPAPD